MKDAEVKMNNYTPFRANKEARSHGGVIIYVRDDVSVATTSLLSYSNGQVELLALKLNTLNLIIINCYHHPQCAQEKFTDAINCINVLIEAIPSPIPDIMLCGDLKFPFIQWPEGHPAVFYNISGSILDDQAQAKLVL